MRAHELSSQESLFIQALRDFFPVALKQLQLDHFPKIKLQLVVAEEHQPTFGRFVNDEKTIYLAINNRHIVDILRTLAHEMTHYKQFLEGQLGPHSGATGSPEEDQGHDVAGVIMRHFDKQFPQYLKTKPIEIK